MKSLFCFTLSFLICLGSCSSSGISSHESGDVEDSQYQLESLELGIAFPPSSTEEIREQVSDHMDNLSVDLLRIQQDWALREPEQNAFHWAPLQGRLDDFSHRNKRVMITLSLSNFPYWTEELSQAQLEEEFRQYVSILLEEYGSQISYIQLGNEWNWELDQHFEGQDALYIRLCNILFEEVEALEGEKPSVLLGSLSIGGLRTISFSYGHLENVTFPMGDLYSDQDLSQADELFHEMIPRIKQIIGLVNFHGVDLHLYDDFWNWELYQQDLKTLISEAGKNPLDYYYVASEFGGPHPLLEDPSESYRSERLKDYVHTLDSMDIQWALFFKLVEDPGPQVAHPNSFLLDSDGQPTISYEVYKLFSQ